MHVDEFIDRRGGDKYARWVLALFRFPAVLALDFREWIAPFKLFCTYKGARYRVTGCSRMGDLYLHPNFDRNFDVGSPYESPGFRGVDVAECSDWGPTAARDE